MKVSKIDAALGLPPLREIGAELLCTSQTRRCFSLALPFFWCAAYFAWAAFDWWPAAVFALVALSFVTYGSVSHDLVQHSLGLSKRANDIFLSVVELVALRSGHAYQSAHLHHHARFPHSDDMESTASRRCLLGALAEGFTFQFRVWIWALRNAKEGRSWIVGEGIASLLLLALALILTPITPVFLVYAVLMLMGSWLIPVVTSYLPHEPEGKNALFQTRVFRGWFFSIVALDHLYHLEHHQYPGIPHHHWPTLAKRLDPYLARAGVKPIRFWF
jgi:beta-carotene hydroxylase